MVCLSISLFLTLIYILAIVPSMFKLFSITAERFEAMSKRLPSYTDGRQRFGGKQFGEL
jgi:hypothetical protein